MDEPEGFVVSPCLIVLDGARLSEHRQPNTINRTLLPLSIAREIKLQTEVYFFL